MTRGRATFLIACLLFVFACQKETPKNEYKLIVYIEVKGACREDHVRQAPEYSSEYTGSIVHWLDITKNIHFIYGSAHDDKSTDRIFGRIQNPNKYYPPFMIKFSQLSADQLIGDTLNLKGVSEHLSGGENANGPRYEATCVLKVLRRLDHIPGKDPSNS